MTIKVAAYIDGFNLYHAIHDLGQNHLKWVDLWKLCEMFAARPAYELTAVHYFSAYATWLTDAYRRHQAFVRAIGMSGVVPVLGNFKGKQRDCRRCKASWIAHEEKETDVNIALHLLDGAYRGEYERAVLISADSDLTPAVKMLRQRFPQKEVRIVTPVAGMPSLSLLSAAGQKKRSRILKSHIESCLMPRTLTSPDGTVTVVRPIEYDPPSLPAPSSPPPGVI